MAFTWFEIRRQLFHAALGLLIVFLIHYDLISALHLFILFSIGIIISIICKKYHVPIFKWFLKYFDRRYVCMPGEGVLYYVFGCFLVVGIFPKNIALASIMILALGDSVSTVVGKNFGRKKVRGYKTWLGAFAGMFFGTLGAVIFVPFHFAILASVITMFIEAYEMRFLRKVINDNLYIPVISSIIMYLLMVII